MTSEATGEVELDGKVLVIRRIHVKYHLKIALDKRAVAERVLSFHANHCPVARSIGGCVAITTSLDMEDA